MKTKKKYGKKLFTIKRKEWKAFRKMLKKEFRQAVKAGGRITIAKADDDAAYQALKEHEAAWNNPARVGPGPNMNDTARKYGTTAQAMLQVKQWKETTG